MTLASGTRLGRYEVRALLGAGGMGEVYLAYDQDLEREVAIKVLRAGSETSSDRVRRFVQEAKASSALHHPNVAHVYEIGTHDDIRFIAMELVRGETLRKRMRSGPMPIDDALDIATQIAAALGAAHKAAIVHRDIKPENVIITPDGYAKVLDFGLAKLRQIPTDGATLLKTEPGLAMGTLGYMAPEQLVGSEITPAADVFSLGVVLYEMVAGHRPFEGSNVTEIVSAILTKTPTPVHIARPEVPPKLEGVISKALTRNVDQRYVDAGEMHEQLRMISRQSALAAHAKESVRRPGAVRIAIAVLAIAILAGGGWAFVRAKRQREAMAKIEAAEHLLKERKLAEAYQTATEAAAILPNDARLHEVISRTADRLTIESDPPGATVYLQRFNGPPQRARMGVTPLTIPKVARADYILTLEKPGHAPAIRTFSMLPFYNLGELFLVDTPTIRMKLAKASTVPPGMVLVEGGTYRLSAYHRPSDRAVELRDFFIDRYEVSNREFEQFIRDGGYRRRELWKHPFVDKGKTLSFEEAMERFRDTTSLPGPRGWSGGAAPVGREDHPVTDVTWYEAAAFAEWKGKQLPSIYQWEKAGRNPAIDSVEVSFPWGMLGEGVDATERSNFLGKGTMAVDTMPFGASPWGAHHMAGNVSEWCRNPNPPGYAARGGAWRDGVHTFGRTAAYPGFFSAPTLGFRCVTGGGGDEGDFALNPSGFVPVYKPVDDRTFADFRRRYDYKKEPLNARVIERVDTPDWTREKITYVVAGKTVPVYLYLPKGFQRPVQVIHFAPAGDVTQGLRTLPHSIEVQIGALIRGGRAVFAVMQEGFLGRPRPKGWVRPASGSEEYVDYNVERVTEMRRALDYIDTRQDLDHSRMALLGVSAGGGPGVFLTALESRYRSVLLSGTGISTSAMGFAPAANRINFVSRISAPKLMLHGRYDEDTPLKSEAEPMFRLLREPKRLELYEGGHIAPQEIAIPTFTRWLDETMGPVKQ